MENTYLPIILSSRLRDILIKINDNVSQTILNLEENNDYAFPFSFLDITEDESTISFLQSNKFNDLPKERGNGDLAWCCSARNEMRAGRLINKIGPFFKPHEIESWVNSFKAEFKNTLKNIKFKIIEGQNIVKYYNGKKYARGNGPLNKSCMRHDGCAEFMDLYIKNPDKIKMLILLEGGKELISGRALLWKLDEPKNTWLLDRIYVKEDSDTILFKKYAEKHGWLYKSAQTFDAVKVVKNGIDVMIDMKIYVRGDYKYFPYIDTLLYFNKKDNYLTNIEKEYETVSQIIKLREINGGDSGNENFVYDVINKEFINIEDSIYCYYGDGYTYKNNVFFIKEYDEYVLPSELRYSSYHKRFVTNQSSNFSKTLCSFILDSDISKVYFTKDKKTYDFLLKKDINKIFALVNDNLYIMDLLVKGIDGDYHFKDEYDEKSILTLKDTQKKAVDDIIKSSYYVREVMGLDDKIETRKKRFSKFGLFT
jgi:hypothetical protein